MDDNLLKIPFFFKKIFIKKKWKKRLKFVFLEMVLLEKLHQFFNSSLVFKKISLFFFYSKSNFPFQFEKDLFYEEYDPCIEDSFYK